MAVASPPSGQGPRPTQNEESLITAPEFAHLDGEGRLQMVDITAKESTRRVARARCVVVVPDETSRDVPRAIQFARLAGIQTAKRTAELIPLCHPLALTHVNIDVAAHDRGYEVTSEVVTEGRTGVEMEALTACMFAALTLINSVVEGCPQARVEDLALSSKSGGKSGDWGRDVH